MVVLLVLPLLQLQGDETNVFVMSAVSDAESLICDVEVEFQTDYGAVAGDGWVAADDGTYDDAVETDEQVPSAEVVELAAFLAKQVVELEDLFEVAVIADERESVVAVKIVVVAAEAQVVKTVLVVAWLPIVKMKNAVLEPEEGDAGLEFVARKHSTPFKY